MVKRLIINIIIFLVAILLLLTIGIYGVIYTMIVSVFKFKTVSFLKYWGDFFYSINVGIDKIGNVFLSMFLNEYTIKDKSYPFGNINHTISHVLAFNYINGNLKPLGKFIVDVLERLDPGHMDKSL